MTVLRHWLPSEETINGRVELAKEKLIAKVADCHRRVLDSQRQVLSAALALDPNNPLEKADAPKGDVVTEMAAEVFRGTLIYRRMEACNFDIKRRTHFLLLSVFFGLALIMVAVGLPSLRPFVTLGAIAVFTFQWLAVIGTRSRAKQIEEYERSL